MQGKIETYVGIFVLAALAVFAYMGLQIGVFRFDIGRYNTYYVYFKDISGLSRKADVSIAGVKVGWVEKLDLISDGERHAKATVMIFKNHNLYEDAYAIIRQDGLLGPKYIELVPGDPLLDKLSPGEPLGRPSIEPVAVDSLMQQVKNIAGNMQEITESFKGAVGGMQGKEQLREFFQSLHATGERIASFADVLERSFSRNEDHIDALLEVGTHIRRLSEKLESDLFPAFKDSVEKVSNSLDRDFARIASRIETTADAFQDATVQARDGLRSVSSVAEKIDEGKGVLGKLINEDETYRDIKVAIAGFKNYLAKMDRLQVIFDFHSETMLRRAENYAFEDAKGYLNVRLHPSEDYFYVFQLVSSEKGYVQRKETHREYCDIDGNPIDTNMLNVTDGQRLNNVFNLKKEKYKRNSLLMGAQVGKIFKDVALRIGLFEGSAGAGVDIDIPFRIPDTLRWVTTFEVFDLSGWNRKDDRRPHLKWLNRMFVFNNLYFTFGADDFASKRNASVFLGAGLRFGDDDVKYLLPGILNAAGSATCN